MQFSKRVTTILVFGVMVSALLAAQQIITTEMLCNGRWYNDEFAFHFSADGTFKAYQTQNKIIGTVLGTWKFGEASTLSLEKQSQEGEYFPIVFKDNGICQYSLCQFLREITLR